MHRASWALLFCWVLLYGCTQTDQRPAVSDIEVKVNLARFDRALFAIDTNRLSAELTDLSNHFAAFYAEYMQFILGVNGNPGDTATLQATRQFLHHYKSVNDSLQLRFSDTRWLEKELEESFKYLRYYFPNYKPGTITFYTGPFDAPGIATVRSGTAVGLQQFGGADFFAYRTAELQALYPTYLSRRFAPPYIVPGIIKAISEDLFPPQGAELPLIEQMVEKGKYWYLASLLLPDYPDSLLTGYTQQQLDWCQENEGLIWSHLIKSEDLNSLNPIIIQTY